MTRALKKPTAAVREQLADIRAAVIILARVASRIQAGLLDPPELVADLSMDNRVTTALRHAGIIRVVDLTRLIEAELLEVKHLGRYGLRCIKRALARHGLALSAQVTP